MMYSDDDTETEDLMMYSDEETEDSYEAEETTMTPTEDPVVDDCMCMTETDYSDLMARIERLETAVSDNTDAVGTLEMDINDVDNGVSTVASYMASYLDGRDDGDMEDSDDMETTEYVEPETTEAPRYVFEAMDTKCGMGSERSFKLDFTTLDNCNSRCEIDGDCQYFSVNYDENGDATLCIGCDAEPVANGGEGWTTYMRNSGDRRALSELEALRYENAQLRKHLN